MSIASLGGGGDYGYACSNSTCDDLKGYMNNLDQLLNETEKNPDRSKETESLSNKIVQFMENEDMRHTVSALI